MTIELEMLTWVTALTIFLWVPYILAHIVSVGLLSALTYKGDATALSNWAARAKKAHSNAIENLVPFAALITTAHLLDISNAATTTAATAYFWFRVAHFVLYTANVPFGRTLTFAGGWLAQLCILFQILAA
ncbi:MAG: putative MAPEG superfamily protein [Halieaceae bacterium]|jgi:uncharacterized MAPEG superfamily protein